MPSASASSPASRGPERELVLAMVAGRILRPNSRLATNRWWRNTTLPQEFAIADDLYAAMDWLDERQEGIQGRLARRWIAQDDLVLWDLSSTWYEGSHTNRRGVQGQRSKAGDALHHR